MYVVKLTPVIALLGLATPALLQSTYTVWYDNFYDQKDTSVSAVACSTALLSRGISTFGSLGTYPFIGGAPQIQSWDSPNCATCWGLAYTNPNGDSTSLSFTAINTGHVNPDGFTISLAGMNFLTNGLAQTLDGVSVTVTQMLPSLCGLS